VMDFDDLLFNWREFSSMSGCAGGYAGRFLQILVDEYQDTNRSRRRSWICSPPGTGT